MRAGDMIAPDAGPAFEPVEYHLDADDRFVWVNDAWRFFADENDAPLETREPLGRPIWDFVTNPETRHLYMHMFAKVRQWGRPITVEFRCDAPACRRVLSLTMSRRGPAGLALRVEALALDPREPVALIDARAARDHRLLTMCGWCKKVRLEERGWVDVEVAVAELSLFHAPALPRITHGICPACLARVEATA